MITSTIKVSKTLGFSAGETVFLKVHKTTLWAKVKRFFTGKSDFEYQTFVINEVLSDTELAIEPKLAEQ